MKYILYTYKDNALFYLYKYDDYFALTSERIQAKRYNNLDDAHNDAIKAQLKYDIECYIFKLEENGK